MITAEQINKLEDLGFEKDGHDRYVKEYEPDSGLVVNLVSCEYEHTFHLIRFGKGYTYQKRQDLMKLAKVGIR